MREEEVFAEGYSRKTETGWSERANFGLGLLEEF